MRAAQLRKLAISAVICLCAERCTSCASSHCCSARQCTMPKTECMLSPMCCAAGSLPDCPQQGALPSAAEAPVLGHAHPVHVWCLVLHCGAHINTHLHHHSSGQSIVEPSMLLCSHGCVLNCMTNIHFVGSTPPLDCCCPCTTEGASTCSMCWWCKGRMNASCVSASFIKALLCQLDCQGSKLCAS